MTDHTRTEKIGDDSISIFVVIRVERKTVMTLLISNQNGYAQCIMYFGIIWPTILFRKKLA